MLLDTYAPLKRVKKYKLKFKSKPWITILFLDNGDTITNPYDIVNIFNKKTITKTTKKA